MRTIEFPTQKTIQLNPDLSITTNTVDLKRTIDDVENNRVISTLEIQGRELNVILWDANSTPTYSTCGSNNDGQWVDSDVDSRLNELL